MDHNYIIPYPYSITIALLVVCNILLVVSYADKIKWKKYISGMVFTGAFGVAQIHGLENLGSKPAWYFPEGSSYWGSAFGHVYWDDILFVPACYSIFYFFMFLIRRVPDFVPRNSYLFIISVAIVLEALLYQVGGEGTRILMIAYTLTPLLFFMFYCMIAKPSLNVTHAILTLLFVVVFSSVWELFNAWRQHWVYDVECNLYGEHGWFFNYKLHVGIFLQYAWSGFVVMYATLVIYGGKDDYSQHKRSKKPPPFYS